MVEYFASGGKRHTHRGGVNSYIYADSIADYGSRLFIYDYIADLFGDKIPAFDAKN